MNSATEQVISALNVLYQDPNPSAKATASAWLSEFQKSDEAWGTAQLILFAVDAPVEPKLFAAQTFRSKIIHDLASLPIAHRLPLRDSLLTAMRTFSAGPRVILSQIALGLADLCLQLTKEEWNSPVEAMIDLFGKEPGMAGSLLEWLKAMAEEFTGNMKLEVRSEFGREEEVGGEKVVELLSLYISTPGITIELQNQCFSCLSAWLKTGQTMATSLCGSPILISLFSSLSNPELFDSAVDCLVDLIKETQEIDENMSIIQEIVPQLITLKEILKSEELKEDSDSMRGYCRIFVEAGEWYEPLITRHSATFLPLVDAILECSDYSDLSVVEITLNFWYRLAMGVRKRLIEPETQILVGVFERLVEIIIKHLHYANDDATLLGQEADDFRSFRHVIGDTLKDCCSVLTAGRCLERSYAIMVSILTKSSQDGTPVKWQDLEAPLFSMRSMGAEVESSENEILPLIMNMIPNLPTHPKILYAAILVIGRYTKWIDIHPAHIEFQLPYLIAGFDHADSQVSAAAAQSMKYFCKDCSYHLVSFLPQLHAFYVQVSKKLLAEDLLDLTIAITHVIAIVTIEELPQALQLFCMPNIELLHSLTNSTSVATSTEIQAACDALARLDAILHIIGPFPGEGLPKECTSTGAQLWTVIDGFLNKFGHLNTIADKVCIVLRRGITFFGEGAFEVSSAMLESMASGFEKGSSPSYLWITSKLIAAFASRQNAGFESILKGTFERESNKLFGMLTTTAPAQVGDVLDDYVHLLQSLLEYSPFLLYSSPAFPSAFQTLLSALTLYSPAIVTSSLDALRTILGDESLSSLSNPTRAEIIKSVVGVNAVTMVSLLVEELVAFEEDTSSSVLTILRVLSLNFAPDLVRAVPFALEKLSIKSATLEEKANFLSKFNIAITSGNPNNVKEAFMDLLRSARKTRATARRQERE